MEKRVWTMPQAEVEKFEMNAYCASACGESGTHYKFKCTAGGGVSGNVYVETNGVEGLQYGDSWQWWNWDESLGGYHACDIEHAAEANDVFLNGYYCPDGSNEVIPVVIWKGENNNNVHCTTNLVIDNWQTFKS